mgnify:CR=1 FL=1
MSEQNTGRYSVGQEIIGINFCYEGRKIAGVLIPYIYNDEKPSRIVFNKLTVTEHHKVPWDQDSSENPEKKYDTNRGSKEHLTTAQGKSKYNVSQRNQPYI